MSKKTVVIVGAGLSGLTAAKHLLQNGINAILLDKGRVVGGRCSTRKLPAHTSFDVADMGAQYFPAPLPKSTSAFAQIVSEWKSAGLLTTANVSLVHLNPNVADDKPYVVAVELPDPEKVEKKPKLFFTRRWQREKEDLHAHSDVLFVPHRPILIHSNIGLKDNVNRSFEDEKVAGMNTLAEYLEVKIKELEGVVYTNVEVESMDCKDGKWTIRARRNDKPTNMHQPPNTEIQFEADGVILTPPVPQSIAILNNNKTESLLPQHVESRLAKIKYDPSIALLLNYPPTLLPAPLQFSRYLGIHVLNAINSLSPTSTPAFAPSISWIGLQFVKRIAEPDALAIEWRERMKKAVGRFISSVDIVNAMAAGSGFLPPAPPENNEQEEVKVSEFPQINDGETVVVQADSVWSARMYDTPTDELKSTLISETAATLDSVIPVNAETDSSWWSEAPTYAAVKKWRYAYCVIPDEGSNDGFVSADVGAPLLFAGDAFGYKLVEVPRSEHAENAAVKAVANAANSHVLEHMGELQDEKVGEVVNAQKDVILEELTKADNDVVVWSGYGSEVGGYGVESAVLSGHKAAEEIAKQLNSANTEVASA